MGLVHFVWSVSKNNTSIFAANTVLAELKRHYEYINNWIKTQQRVALFIYMVSAAGGFMLGGVSGSGKTVEEFMSKPMVWVALLIAIAVMAPACYYLARWMCKYACGKHLDALKRTLKN